MSEPDRAKEPPFPERFEAVEPAASTPFERTFQAFDRVLQRRVLLKVPAAAAWDGWSASVRERLMREARSLAKVRHEGVAAIHWVEETASGPLLVLDLPEGESLTDRLAASAMNVDEVRELGIQLAEALGAVHYQGIVHRGVGPDTVRVLASGKVRLGTFTFAKAFDDRLPSSIDHRRRLESRVVAHLPAYVAPEQFAGRGADPRSDVFALGCLLFRCLAGKDPFEPGTEAGVLPDLRTIRREVPKDVADVVRKCTLAVPTARFPTAQAVADALKATRPQAVAGRGGRAQRMGIAIAGGVLLGGLGLWSMVGNGQQPGGAGDTHVIDVGKVYKDTYGSCHALLIGIADYDERFFPKLHTPVQEIDEVERRLLQLGGPWARDGAIRKVPPNEATGKRILDELDLLEGSRIGEEDGVLVYFAGHGEKDLAQYWLIATDADSTDGNRATRGFIQRERLRNLERKCPAKHLLIVLDCCSSSAMFEETEVVASRGRPVEEAVRGRSSLLTHACRQTLTAAHGKASDGTDLPPFAKAFLAAIDPAGQFGQLGHADAQMIHAHIVTAMANAGSGQRPGLKPTDGDGSFVFFFPK